jgi:hypothetical protein
MFTDFPKQSNTFLKSTSFQDQLLTLTFKGWDKKHNVDKEATGKLPASSWKFSLKFCLPYSYPEYAVDPLTGEKRTGKDGLPFRNSNYDPNYPQGYTIVYHFDEGVFESGSLPLFKAFCMVRPKKGDTLVIGKTGKDKETKWSVKRVQKEHSHAISGDVPDIDMEKDFSSPEFNADPNPDDSVPF